MHLGTLLHRAATLSVGAYIFIRRGAGKARNAEAFDLNQLGGVAVAINK